MAAITLDDAKAHLAAWMAADLALSTSQQYTIDVSGTRRMLTRANASEVKERIKFWSHTVNQKTRTRVRYGVPTDF